MTKAQGYFPVTLQSGGKRKDYKLFYSVESVAWLEDEFDLPVEEVLQKLAERRWGVIGKLVHAGLLHYGDDRELAQTMREIPLEHMLDVLNQVTEAFNFNVPKGEGETDGKKTTAPGTKGGKI